METTGGIRKYTRQSWGSMAMHVWEEGHAAPLRHLAGSVPK